MSVDTARLMRWLRQPTTIGGLAALAGDALMMLVGGAGWRLELPLALGSLVAMALPDNTAAASVATRTLRDVLVAIETRDPKAIADAVSDAQALIRTITV